MVFMSGARARTLANLSLMASTSQPATWKTLLAFAIIYFVWGSTFLAIRIGVLEVPPFLFAAMRFFLAGVILCVWLLFQRQHLPVGRQWLSIVLLATLIFVGDYGLVFWAEQTVPSGVTAVMLATIPAFMALSEILVLRTQRMTVRLALALLIGIAGVAVLVSRSLDLGGQPINATGAMALIVASMSWSVGSILTRKLPLPSSKVVSAGSQMLIGGILLFLVSALLGELPKFHPATLSRAVWISLLYLSIAGSVIAFTAYLWLGPPPVADEGWHLRLRQSRHRRLAGILLRRRIPRPANRSRNTVRSHQRGHNHDHTRKEARAD